MSNNIIVSGIEITKYNYFSNKLMAAGITVFAIYFQLIKTLNYHIFFIDFANIPFKVKKKKNKLNKYIPVQNLT